MIPFRLEDRTLASLRTEKEEFRAIFEEYGVLWFPGLLEQEEVYQHLIADLRRLMTMLYEHAQRPCPKHAPLDALVTDLAATHRALVGSLYDIGTRPHKLMHGMRLKWHPDLLALVQELLGEGGLVASPSLSDTLHVFPPGEENFKYNLPTHQDFPYLMQSPDQITVFFNMSSHIEGVGGVTLWPGSYRLGVVRHRKNDVGHYEVELPAETMNRFEPFDIVSNPGDLVVFHSLTLHRSIRNQTKDASRLVQIFRYSDVASPKARRFLWGSSEYGGGGPQFPDHYPEP